MGNLRLNKLSAAILSLYLLFDAIFLLFDALCILIISFFLFLGPAGLLLLSGTYQLYLALLASADGKLRPSTFILLDRDAKLICLHRNLRSMLLNPEMLFNLKLDWLCLREHLSCEIFLRWKEGLMQAGRVELPTDSA